MRGYDIIGDVHGCASMLVERLTDLGYARRQGVGAYLHPDYHAVFVGDLIDRGPQQRETLELVKAMVDAGTASIVMGNHEFNAVAYATELPDSPGRFLRTHSEKNTKQHRAFLDQLTESQRNFYVDWFKTLPLWLTLPNPDDAIPGGTSARVVHACWHAESISAVEDACGGNWIRKPDQWILANDRVSELYRAVEVLLKGPEIPVKPYGLEGFRDKDGHPREEARLCWWKGDSKRVDELLEHYKSDPKAAEIVIGDDDAAYSYLYRETVPVFYGHYWRKDIPEHTDDFTVYTACVDFSAVVSRNASAGTRAPTLVAYRWEGEPTIQAQNYFPRTAAHKASV
jgi:hypothetical protein